MNKKRLPLIYRIIRGAIGKRFVIKHYSYGIIKTKFPNMKNIIPSEAQKQRRRLFRHAVKYAQDIYANPTLKEEKRRILHKPKRLFQALMKEWFKKRAERNFWNQRRLKQWKNKAVIETRTIQSISPLNGSENQFVLKELLEPYLLNYSQQCNYMQQVKYSYDIYNDKYGQSLTVLIQIRKTSCIHH